MASLEQQQLSNFIKTVHSNLRDLSQRIGPEAAWHQHLQNHGELRLYSDAMRELSERYWRDNQVASENRIDWIHQFCVAYFMENGDLFQKHRHKEMHIMKIASDEAISKFDFGSVKLRVLDVGSCFNPLTRFERFDAIGIDIAPAEGSGVYKCDFLDVPIARGLDKLNCDQHYGIMELPARYFDVVVFSLLLEYMPSSKQRLAACQKAYDLLKPEGILIVITPDSKHIGANARLMKTWRYALSLMGFSRICIEKLTHITCMVFRKALYMEVPQRWAAIHREPYMVNEINIPQDFVGGGGMVVDDIVRPMEDAKIPASNIKDAFSELPNQFMQ